MRRLPMIGLLGAILLHCGCEMLVEPPSGRNRRALVVTPSAVRAQRRAYEGAPPVIPHALQGVACNSCHTPTGREVPPLGIAPANPHGVDGLGAAVSNCRQCHLPIVTRAAPPPSQFRGLPDTVRSGDRLFPGAPPVIPHPVHLRENCLGCHDGPAARPEILCRHPERKNCFQCHLERRSDQEFLRQSAMVAGG